ncbi:MAG: amidohydrolase family protein [Thermodesulfobacteriota bacterium]
MDRCLVRGKLLIDGTGSPPIEGGVILLEGERILAVGREKDMDTAGVVRTVDCSAQTLLPGLIDCHNHLSLDPTLDNYLYRMNDSIPELTLRATTTMVVDLESGVTTSRCLGDKGYLDVECRKAVHAGRMPGPRLLIATRGIRAPHGHGFVGYPFSGIEQIRSAVRENLSAGADLIKVYITGTLRSPKGIPSYFSKEEIQVVVDEAHRVGTPVATHCIGGIGLEWALETGIDVIEHGYFMNDREFDLLVKAGKWLVMTPSIFFTEARIRTLPPHLIEGHLQQRDEVGQRMCAAIKAGVKYAVGTDGMHGGLAQEMKYLMDFGATANQALMAATCHAARVCGLEDSIGTLQAGKLGDIIGVEGNPLEDIGALKGVKTVISRGRIRFQAGRLGVP